MGARSQFLEKYILDPDKERFECVKQLEGLLSR